MGLPLSSALSHARGHVQNGGGVMNTPGKILHRIGSVPAILILAFVFGLIAAKSADAQAPIPDAPAPLPPKGPGWPLVVKDNKVFAHVLFDQLEGRASTSDEQFQLRLRAPRLVLMFSCSVTEKEILCK
jgi:hypothetical protein